MCISLWIINQTPTHISLSNSIHFMSISDIPFAAVRCHFREKIEVGFKLLLCFIKTHKIFCSIRISNCQVGTWITKTVREALICFGCWFEDSASSVEKEKVKCNNTNNILKFSHDIINDKWVIYNRHWILTFQKGC